MPNLHLQNQFIKRSKHSFLKYIFTGNEKRIFFLNNDVTCSRISGRSMCCGSLTKI